MEQISEILFICITLPMIPMLFVLPDKQSKLLVGYMMVGSLISLIAGAINVGLLGLFHNDMSYVATTITPISEELLKAIPVLYYALIFSDERDKLLSISFAVGVGFAILENAVILAQNILSSTISIPWALARVTGAALMHGACTSMIGLGLSYVRKRKKLFFCGTFALMITAVIFHATFNLLVQGQYKVASLLLPSSLYLPIIIREFIRRRRTAAYKTYKNK
ncbi:MAG: PrsW family intramembrane metalloprotease [Ruminiclostridium sp.]|nr:PrsW family intramembrane metalloprotease [Ruminiclostridium sp.]